MTLELIAVDGCTLSHAAGSPVSGGTFVITSTPSVYSKVDNKGVYETPLTFTFSGGSFSGASPNTATGAGSIVATAVYCKSDNKLVIREGDSVTVTFTGTNASPPPPTVTIAGDVEISVAGQTSTKGE